jgi:type II secretory pathway pseudopilin PulG
MAIIAMLALIGARVAFTVIDTAKIAKIAVEIKNLETALKDYKNKYGSYPPLLSDRDAVRKHVARRWRDNIDPLPSSTIEAAPAESLAFWLGPFSSDPERPFTGENKLGPTFDFVEQQLGNEVNGEKRDEPRNDDGIRYWRYYPPKLRKAYVYFESRSYETARYDELRPYKKSRVINTSDPADAFVNPNGIQIISAGLDNEYGNGGKFPEGPYDISDQNRGDDNITNFSGRTLEDAKP